MFPSSSSQPTLYGLGISDVSFASQTFPSSQSLSDLPGGDASSPEAFRHNIHLVHQQVARIQSLASSALAEMWVSYRLHTHTLIEPLFAITANMRIIRAGPPRLVRAPSHSLGSGRG